MANNELNGNAKFKSNIKGTLILLITAMIWGASFVSQSAGADILGPNSFNGIRMLLGSVVLMPVCFAISKSQKRKGAKPIDKKKVLQIIKICEENSIYYNVFTEDTILTSSLAYNVLFYNQENVKKPDSKKTNINIIQNIYKYIQEREKEDYLKMCICDKNNIIFGGIMKMLKEVKNVNVMEVAHMARKLIANGTDYVPVEYYITEIMNQNADKWNAVKFLADKFKIKENEIITIGDNVNDEQMLKNAGLGVAMGNSAPYIQEMAKEVTLDNNSGGVAHIVEKYILK